MRVIAGVARGRPLKAPKGRGTRPTSDRVREALFNVLAARVPGARVLDGFAGTGALGIEALSRGARAAVFVEQNPAVAGLIRENLRSTGLGESAGVVVQDVSRTASLEPLGPFDLVFLDPPYDKGWAARLLQAFSRSALLAPEGLLILEHSRREAALEQAPGLERVRQLIYGDTVLSLYRGRQSP